MASNNSKQNAFVPGGGGGWKKMGNTQAIQPSYQPVNDTQNKLVLNQLTELFGSVMEQKAIETIASSYGWNVQLSIDALMEITETTNFPSLPSKGLNSNLKSQPQPRNDKPRPSPSAIPPLAAIKVAYEGYDDSSDDADILIEDEEEVQIVKVAPCIPLNNDNLLQSQMPNKPAAKETKRGPVVKSAQSAEIDVIIESMNRGIKILVLMRGVPGSGKSYLARKLISESLLDAEPDQFIFSTDDFFCQSGRYVFSAQSLPEAHEWNRMRVSAALHKGLSPVVVDNTNTEAWEMKPYVHPAVHYGYAIEMLEPTTPWCRKESELCRRNLHGVPRQNIRNMLERFEKTTVAELMSRFNCAYAYGNVPPQRCSNKPRLKSPRKAQRDSNARRKPRGNSAAPAAAAPAAPPANKHARNGQLQEIMVASRGVPLHQQQQQPGPAIMSVTTLEQNMKTMALQSQAVKPVERKADTHANTEPAAIAEGMAAAADADALDDVLRSVDHDDLLKMKRDLKASLRCGGGGDEGAGGGGGDEGAGNGSPTATVSGEGRLPLTAVQEMFKEDVLQRLKEREDLRGGRPGLSPAERLKVMDQEVDDMMDEMWEHFVSLNAPPESVSVGAGDVRGATGTDRCEASAEKADAEKADAEAQMRYTNEVITDTRAEKTDAEVAMRDIRTEDIGVATGTKDVGAGTNTGDSLAQRREREQTVDVPEVETQSTTEVGNVSKDHCETLVDNEEFDVNVSKDVAAEVIDDLIECVDSVLDSAVVTGITSALELSKTIEASSLIDDVNDQVADVPSVASVASVAGGTYDEDLAADYSLVDSNSILCSLESFAFADVKTEDAECTLKDLGLTTVRADAKQESNCDLSDVCSISAEGTNEKRVVTPPGSNPKTQLSDSFNLSTERTNEATAIPSMDCLDSKALMADKPGAQSNVQEKEMQKSAAKSSGLFSWLFSKKSSNKKEPCAPVNEAPAEDASFVQLPTFTVLDLGENFNQVTIHPTDSENVNSTEEYISTKIQEGITEINLLEKQFEAFNVEECRKSSEPEDEQMSPSEDQELIEDCVSLLLDAVAAHVKEAAAAADEEVPANKRAARNTSTLSEDEERLPETMLPSTVDWTVDPPPAAFPAPAQPTTPRRLAPSTRDGATNTTHLDFSALRAEPTEPTALTMLTGRSRCINDAEPRDTPPPPRPRPNAFALDKGSMTSPVDLAPGRHDFDLLVNMFPRINTDDLREVFDKCGREINWTVELLLESGYAFEPADDVPARLDVSDELDASRLLLDELNTRDVTLMAAAGNLERGVSIGESFRADNTRDLSMMEAAGNATANTLPASPAAKKPPRRQSQLTLQLKKQVEGGVSIGESFYSENTLRLKRQRHGEPGPGGGEGEDGEEEEGEVALALDADFLGQLQRLFGPAPFQYPDGVPAVVHLPVAIARQIHGYLMESQQQQLDMQEAYFQNMIKDEEFARRLQEEEEIPTGSGPGPDLREIMDMELALESYKSSRGAAASPDLATLLSRHKLTELFPDVNAGVLDEVYAAHGHAFAETCAVVQASVDADRAGVRTVAAPGALAAYERRLLQRAKAESLKQSSAGAAAVGADVGDGGGGWSADGTKGPAAMDTAKHYRDEALRLRQLRSDCFQKANNAHRNGQVAVASYYAQVGQLYKEHIETANSRAASALLAANCEDERSTTLDLHFLYVAEAMQALDIFLDHHVAALAESGRRSQPLFIITGSGVHSAGGKPRIKPAVERRLAQRKLNFVEVNPGMLKVVVTKNLQLSSC